MATSPAGGRVRLWFGSEAARSRVAADLRSRLASRGGPAGVEDSARPPLGDGLHCAPPEPPRDWTAAYRDFFRGVRAGGFFVHPPHVPATPELRSLLLTPGPAFGTGMHPTTRMVLESLEDHLRTRRRMRVLDIGTGSGILAVAAALLGARPVVALDVDPLAIRSAEKAAAANRTAGRITFCEGDYRDPALAARLQALVPTGFDVILANLSAESLHDFWDFAQPRLQPGGRVLASGFLREDARRVLRSFPQGQVRIAELRLELPESPASDTWVAAALERRPVSRDLNRAVSAR